MTHPAAVAVAITSASSSIAPVDESALRDDVGASSSEPQTDIEVVVDGERSAQTDPHLPLGDAEPGECVICLGELDDEEDITTTECNHTFHTACVEEWLSKDGRCPTCRRQLREVVPPPTMPALPFLPHDAATRASLQNMAILMLESRRLMMLATMEAALAVLVMSYIAELLAPALMILAAGVTFTGASNYLARSMGAARPLLAINAFYHIYIMISIVFTHQSVPFFSAEYSSARTILLSLGCVAAMEISTARKCAAFQVRLLHANPAELRTLRTSRRAHVGLAQRLIVLVMLVLICAPVVARWVCGGSSAQEEQSEQGMCQRR